MHEQELIVDKKDAKMGLKATLKEEVWKKIGFHNAPQLYINNIWYDPMVVHNKDHSTDYEYIKTIQMGMVPKSGGGCYPVEDVELGWPVYKKEKD